MKKYCLFLVFVCVGFSGLATSLESRYETLDKPLDIPYTINNKKMVMHTYLANKKQRTSTLYKRILYYIYNQQFKKYGIELDEAEKNKINQLGLKSSPHKKIYLKYLKSLCSQYEDVYKISSLMRRNKLTPIAAYEQYTKNNKTKLSKSQWQFLFSTCSFEWLEKFAQTDKKDRMKLIPNPDISLILQISLLWEKLLFASHYDVKQAASKWQAEVNALSIEVPKEYSAVKTKVLKTLQALFPLKVDLLKDKKLRPAYEELKRLTNTRGAIASEPVKK